MDVHVEVIDKQGLKKPINNALEEEVRRKKHRDTERMRHNEMTDLMKELNDITPGKAEGRDTQVNYLKRAARFIVYLLNVQAIEGTTNQVIDNGTLIAIHEFATRLIDRLTRPTANGSAPVIDSSLNVFMNQQKNASTEIGSEEVVVAEPEKKRDSRKRGRPLKARSNPKAKKLKGRIVVPRHCKVALATPVDHDSGSDSMEDDVAIAQEPDADNCLADLQPYRLESIENSIFALYCPVGAAEVQYEETATYQGIQHHGFNRLVILQNNTFIDISDEDSMVELIPVDPQLIFYDKVDSGFDHEEINVDGA